MRIVSPFLKRVLYPALSLAGVFRRISSSGLAVVTYHGVLPQGYEWIDPVLDGNLISSDTLRRHLRLLKANYNVISPEDVLAWREKGCELPPRAVLLTCDDGLLNNLTDMLPVLQQEGVRCLFFVTGTSAEEERTMLWYEELLLLLLKAPKSRFEVASDHVTIRGDLGSRGQRRVFWWNAVERLSRFSAETRSSFLSEARARLGLDRRQYFDEDVPATLRRFGLLTAAELRQLAAARMTIGAHTLSHPILSEASPELARAEVAECRAKLASVVQQRIWALAYPFGDPQSVTPEVLAIPEECGYEAGFLNFGGGLGADLPPYALPRIHATSEMSLAEFDARVSGFHLQLQQLSGRGVK
jgi:peptidoglycan/xylan/chitin deacetylase (PgdA/CDA1 family)